MATDGVLVLAGLFLAHLVADFLLQTGGIVADKGASGRRVLRGLGLHGVGVAACLVPFVVVFGAPGLWTLGLVTATHVVIDRAKAVATRRAEARALAAAHSRHASGVASPIALGPAWTPVPAGLFILDQAVHAAILVGAWAIWLAAATPVADVAGAVDAALGGWDRAAVHDAALTVVVLASLVIVNVRAGALFVAILVHPREAVTGAAMPDEPPSAGAAGVAATAAARGTGWRIRLGPLEAVVEPAVVEAARPVGRDAGHASPARVGATIGIIERLLIATFVLTGAEAAIGFVVAAKTLARFRQLDDRDFAEYYLLGTLASVSVALGSALLAAAALGTLAR
ncbi:MAG TPA: DUF3307 domain-containing protein [Candidatus Limnocylindrales bacterium]|nr:DUF3307 domain-containing protein [Candidatus Limnocylindrales bacterium]